MSPKNADLFGACHTGNFDEAKKLIGEGVDINYIFVSYLLSSYMLDKKMSQKDFLL